MRSRFPKKTRSRAVYRTAYKNFPIVSAFKRKRANTTMKDAQSLLSSVGVDVPLFAKYDSDQTKARAAFGFSTYAKQMGIPVVRKGKSLSQIEEEVRLKSRGQIKRYAGLLGIRKDKSTSELAERVYMEVKNSLVRGASKEGIKLAERNGVVFLPHDVSKLSERIWMKRQRVVPNRVIYDYANKLGIDTAGKTRTMVAHEIWGKMPRMKPLDFNGIGIKGRMIKPANIGGIAEWKNISHAKETSLDEFGLRLIKGKKK